jgi:hypothetical protein
MVAKENFMKRLLVIGTICALAAFAADEKAKTAEKKKPAGSGMMAPKPAPEARELRDFLGTWKSTETYEKSEMMPGGEGTSTITATQGPGGYSIVLHVKATSGPMSNFRGMGVIAWSAEDKEYKEAWVDSMSAGLVVQTGHKEGNDLVMKGEMKMMGKTYKTRDVISDRTPTSYTLTSYMDDGSGEKKSMTIKAVKEEKPKEEKPATK